MCRRLQLLFFIILFLAGCSDSERTLTAETQFQNVLSETPEKEVNVAVSFTNEITLETIRGALLDSLVTPKSFRHVTQSDSGGYGLKPGETIDEAIVNYRKQHQFFLEKRIEVENEMVKETTDEDFHKAVIAKNKETKKMKGNFSEDGLRITGVELYGEAEAIQNFMNKNSFVRVIELLEDGKKQSTIQQQ